MKKFLIILITVAQDMIHQPNLFARDSRSPFTAPPPTYFSTSAVLRITRFEGSIDSGRVMLRWNVDENEKVLSYRLKIIQKDGVVNYSAVIVARHRPVSG